MCIIEVSHATMYLTNGHPKGFQDTNWIMSMSGSIWKVRQGPWIVANRSTKVCSMTSCLPWRMSSYTDVEAEECLDSTSSTVCEGLLRAGICVSRASLPVIIPLLHCHMVQKLMSFTSAVSSVWNSSVGFCLFSSGDTYWLSERCSLIALNCS